MSVNDRPDDEERGIVAAVLAEPGLLDCVPHLEAHHFRLTDCQEAWGRIQAAARDGERLYMSDFAGIVAKAYHVEPIPQYVRDMQERILKAASLRDVVNTCGATVTAAYAGDVEVVRRNLEGLAGRIGTTGRSSAVSAHQAASEAYDRYGNPEAARESIVPTFQNLDTALSGGLPKPGLTILMGRPSMGKTSSACFMASCQLDAGLKVYYASAEESRQRIIDRLVFGRAGLSMAVWREGKLSNQQLAVLARQVEVVAKLPLWVDDFGGRRVSAGDVAAAIASHAVLHGAPDVVYVDHIGELLLGNAENRNVGLGNSARELRSVAKMHNLALVAACQLRRSVEDKRPDMDDLYESGHLEQVADVVIGLYRPAYYNPNSDAGQRAEFIVRKNRDGMRDEAAAMNWLGSSRWFSARQERTVKL